MFTQTSLTRLQRQLKKPRHGVCFLRQVRLRGDQCS